MDEDEWNIETFVKKFFPAHLHHDDKRYAQRTGPLVTVNCGCGDVLEISDMEISCQL